MRYKRVVITRHGPAEVLQVIEEDVPQPGMGEVRLNVLAAGVAFTDVLVREGLYPGIPKVPFSPGYTVVGRVDAVGTAVTSLRSGQRVAALTIVGGYSEFICLPASDCVVIPEEVDAAEAVCLVLQYVTAEQLLHRVAQVKSGNRILIHGAAGGVGTALLQLGKLAGLEMYGTASASKHELVRRLGGIPIDYQHHDFVEQIRTLTGEGVDVVLDAIGGWHLLQSYRSLRKHGQLVCYGFSSALANSPYRIVKLGFTFALLAWLKLLPTGRQVHFYSIADLKAKHPDWFRADLTRLLQLLAEGKLYPILSDRLPLTEAARAHEQLEHSRVSGQLVLQSCDRDRESEA
uniref:Alcohol dehydrogenase zinc-binding domain protein n=1 Tax=Cyanothece sp. (strain PCC 7425 / ATCC 29141) TaxID=395961 RepID=B8HSC2_CYAP4